MSTPLESAEKRNARRMSGVVLSYAYTLAQAIVGIIYVPLLINGLGTNEYGLYQLIGSVMANMAILNSTFAGGVTRFYCKYFSSRDINGMENTLAISRNIYRVVSLAAILIGGVVVLLFGSAYAASLSENQLLEGSVMIAVLVVNLIVTMNNTINVAVINAHERFAFLKSTQLASVLIQPIAVVLLLSVFPYALTACLVQLALNVLCALAQRLFARRHLGAKVRKHADTDHLLKSLLFFSSGMLLVQIADQVFWSSNQLILGYIYGTSTVALYSIASQICMCYMPIGTAISSVFMPKVSEMYFSDRDTKGISDLFTRVGRIALYPLLLILFGFIVFGKDFIRLWVGSEFSDAYYLAAVLMVPFTIDLIQNLALVILQVMNKYYFRGKVYLGMAIANSLLVILIAPVYGAMGAAIVTGLSMLIGNGVIMNVYYYRTAHLDVRDYWKNTARVALPLAAYSTAGFFIVYHFQGSLGSWVLLALGIAIFTIGYCFVAYCCSMNKEERELVGKMIGRITRKSRSK